MLIFGGKPRTRREFQAGKRYTDEMVAEILKAASVEVPPDFAEQIRLWAVIVLGMIEQQQKRRDRDRARAATKSRTPKEETAARDALKEMHSKLKVAVEALRGLPMLAQEAMLREGVEETDRLKCVLLAGINHVQKAKRQIAVNGGGPRGHPVLNRAILLLMSVCEYATGRKVQAVSNGWFVEIAERLVEPLFPELGEGEARLGTRISRLAASRT